MMSLRSAAGTAALLVAVLALGGCTDSNPNVLGSTGDGTAGANGAAATTSQAPVDVENLPASGAPAPTRHTGPQGVVGQFVTDCALSHTAPDDPIVFPAVAREGSSTGSGGGSQHAGHMADSGSSHSGPAGSGSGGSRSASHSHSGSDGAEAVGHSHMHNFYGNTTTDSASTLETLLDGDTTCKKQLDTAAYWAPELMDHGVAVVPTKSTAYYRAGVGVDPTQVKAYPPGLMVVAGDANATPEDPQSPELAGWTCGTSTIQVAQPPECPASAPLRGVITFPDCWDGVNVDSADHRSHMANSSGGLCPASHPVHVPQLTFAITFPIWGSGHDLSLASGSTSGLHSDFINSWHQPALQQEINLCLHRKVVCSLSSNRGEESLFTG